MASLLAGSCYDSSESDDDGTQFNVVDESASENIDMDGSDVDVMDEVSIKSKGKKKAGRKSQWPEKLVEDLIDIILENDEYTTKLITTNSKKVRNAKCIQ